jgi:hypothetical protein
MRIANRLSSQVGDRSEIVNQEEFGCQTRENLL